MLELKGKPVADAITGEMKEKIAALAEAGTVPTLAIVRVGERADDLSYERGAVKRFAAAGATAQVHALPTDCTPEELERTIAGLNDDPAVHGVLLLRPLPKHLDEDRVRRLLAPEKDVDCLTDAGYASLLAGGTLCPPCTPRAVVELIDHYGIGLTGKRVTVVGRSLVVGKPLALLLLAKNATVTVCHTRTKNLAAECRAADVIVTCAGQARMIGPECVKPGQIVIDVGISLDETGHLCGDVDFKVVKDTVAAITPVPRGVGSITTAVLLKHTVNAAARQLRADG